MPAQYTLISLDEMDAFLTDRGFRVLPIPETSEVVYAKRARSRPPITIRVYTSITEDGAARAVGQDAIRVCVIGAVPAEYGAGFRTKGILKARRVHRVQGWRKNLDGRIRDAIEAVDKMETCPACGHALVPRKARKTGQPFHGCSAYPSCTYTKPSA